MRLPRTAFIIFATVAVANAVGAPAAAPPFQLHGFANWGAKPPFGHYTEVFDVGTTHSILALPHGIYGPAAMLGEVYNGVGFTGGIFEESWWVAPGLVIRAEYHSVVGNRFIAPLNSNKLGRRTNIVQFGSQFRS